MKHIYYKPKNAAEYFAALSMIVELSGLPLDNVALDIKSYVKKYPFSVGDVVGTYGGNVVSWSGTPSFALNLYTNLHDIICHFETTTVKLNDTYTAEVLSDGNVRVGCQTFTFAAIKELAGAVKKMEEQK